VWESISEVALLDRPDGIRWKLTINGILAVCILVMQRPGVYLKLLSNKALFIEKKVCVPSFLQRFTEGY
jgi:hypothetical protein